MSLSFLEKVPKEYFCIYNGTSEEFKCTPKDFCDNPAVISHYPNMMLADSYDNWVGRYDLACASSFKVGFIASSFFLGWISTLFFLPRLSDLFGRQKIIVMGNVVQTLAYTVILMTKSYALLIVSMILLGMMSTVRLQVCVVYIYESMKKEHFTKTYAAIACFEGVLGLAAVLYFKFISKDYFWLLLSGYILQVAGSFASFFFPESPRYLIKTGMITEATSVLNQISYFNGSDVKFGNEQIDEMFNIPKSHLPDKVNKDKNEASE